MNILIDIGHPAHVHFFRNAVMTWQRKHSVIITARQKDGVDLLLKSYGLEYKLLSRPSKRKFGLLRELFIHEARLLQIARKFNPRVILSVAGTFNVHAAQWLRIPSIVFYDTEHAKMQNLISYPFATKICTPSCYQGDMGKKHIRYSGYQELAYLHPNEFVPDASVLKELHVQPDSPFFILRFVSWGASHDIGQAGFSESGKRRLVASLKAHGDVFISSEAPLPPELEPHRLTVSPEKIHDLLFYASMYIGEGATMASEAAVLGTPSVFVSSLSLGYLMELEEKYQLVHSFAEQKAAMEYIQRTLGKKSLKKEWADKRARMLEDKIDVTPWIVDLIDTYQGQDNDRT